MLNKLSLWHGHRADTLNALKHVFLWHQPGLSKVNFTSALRTWRRDSLAALEAAKGGTQKFLERAQEKRDLTTSDSSDFLKSNLNRGFQIRFQDKMFKMSCCRSKHNSLCQRPAQFSGWKVCIFRQPAVLHALHMEVSEIGAKATELAGRAGYPKHQILAEKNEMARSGSL